MGILGLGVIALIISSVEVSAASRHGLTGVVIPARYRVVQFAFDIDHLRDVILIAYQTHPDLPKTVLHVWRGGHWMELDLARYRLGSFSKNRPERLIVVGSDDDTPADLLDASSWAADIERIRTLDLVTLVNSFGTSFALKNSEWKWLVGRHDLKIHDMNWKRRRYGRWSMPDEERPKKPRRSWLFWKGADAKTSPRKKVDRVIPRRVEIPDPRIAPIAPPVRAEPVVETVVEAISPEPIVETVVEPIAEPLVSEKAPIRVEFKEEITEPEPLMPDASRDWLKGGDSSMPENNIDDAGDAVKDAREDVRKDVVEDATEDTREATDEAAVVSLDDLDPDVPFDPGDK
tara:strand:+ start:120 stop:1157 length:1038 start_codon:yes stop_codon:yes gene_type:complete